MKTRFACGSMVLLSSFAQKIGTLCQFFVQKKGIFHPAGGETTLLGQGPRNVCLLS
jgi:hypothetical protein